VLIYDRIDSLLAFDSIEPFECRANGGNQVLAVATIDSDFTIGKRSLNQLLYLRNIQNCAPGYCQLSRTASISLLCWVMSAANCV